jgi:hypothetical protein
MEILSKNVLLMEALKNQNAWLIKFELKKNINYSSLRYNQFIVPEFKKIFPENVLNEAEIRVLYQEDFIIKKFDKFKDMMDLWKDVPAMESLLKNPVVNDYIYIYCSALDKEGLEIKNNKKS